MSITRPYVLCVGGFDPSAGAGVLADVKTLEQLKVTGLAVLTCITIQSDNKFVRLDWCSIEVIQESIELMMRTYRVDFVKIGVVKDENMLKEIVNKILSHNPACKIVWDTVLGSSSGYNFFEVQDDTNFKKILLKFFVITPNLMEYKEVLSKFITSELLDNCSLLIKGGHNIKSIGVDYLNTKFESIEIKGNSEKLPAKHGSGCVFASAITGYLALGHDLSTSCHKAKEYIQRFLQSNTTLLGYHYE